MRVPAVERSLDNGITLALGIPGRSKYRLTKTFFARLWKMASERVAAANEIYFLNRRFPETDAAAHETLLDSITARNEWRDSAHRHRPWTGRKWTR